MGFPRFDFNFNYWLFVWFLLYIFAKKVVKFNIEPKQYAIINPFVTIAFTFILSVISTIIYVVNIVNTRQKAPLELFYIIEIFIALGVPLVFLRKEPRRLFVNIFIGILFHLLYLGYLKLNGVNLIQYFELNKD